MEIGLEIPIEEVFMLKREARGQTGVVLKIANKYDIVFTHAG